MPHKLLLHILCTCNSLIPRHNQPQCRLLPLLHAGMESLHVFMFG